MPIEDNRRNVPLASKSGGNNMGVKLDRSTHSADLITDNSLYLSINFSMYTVFPGLVDLYSIFK